MKELGKSNRGPKTRYRYKDGEVDYACCAPLYEECLQHQMHKEDYGVMPETCGIIGDKIQVNLLWMRALGIGNVSYPWRSHEGEAKSII